MPEPSIGVQDTWEDYVKYCWADGVAELRTDGWEGQMVSDSWRWQMIM